MSAGHSAGAVQYRSQLNDGSYQTAHHQAFMGDAVANNIAINPNHLAAQSNYGQKMVLLPHQAPKDDRLIDTVQEQHIKYAKHSDFMKTLDPMQKNFLETMP